MDPNGAASVGLYRVNILVYLLHCPCIVQKVQQVPQLACVEACLTTYWAYTHIQKVTWASRLERRSSTPGTRTHCRNIKLAAHCPLAAALRRAFTAEWKFILAIYGLNFESGVNCSTLCWGRLIRVFKHKGVIHRSFWLGEDSFWGTKGIPLRRRCARNVEHFILKPICQRLCETITYLIEAFHFYSATYYEVNSGLLTYK